MGIVTLLFDQQHGFGPLRQKHVITRIDLAGDFQKSPIHQIAGRDFIAASFQGHPCSGLQAIEKEHHDGAHGGYRFHFQCRFRDQR